jgi:DNA-binding IclR family transcriptional regulator
MKPNVQARGESTKPEQGRAVYAAPALEKGLDILELLARCQGPMSTRAMAEALGRSKSEIFRMVAVLLRRGYLARDPKSDTLSLTNRLFDLGLRTPPAKDLVATAAPVMQRLARETGQSVHLVVLHRGETVVVANAVGGDDLSFTLKLGYRRAALEASSGLVFLAFQPEEERRRLLATLPRSPLVDGQEPERLMAEIRAAGHLVRPSQDVPGITDIACPILDRRGHAEASLVVPVVNRRGRSADLDPVVAALDAAAGEISGPQGGTG